MSKVLKLSPPLRDPAVLDAEVKVVPEVESRYLSCLNWPVLVMCCAAWGMVVLIAGVVFALW